MKHVGGIMPTLATAASQLLELKKVKRRIEASQATDGEAKWYEAHKEAAWKDLENAYAMEALNQGYRLASTLETQEGGSHYKVRKIQPVEYWAANELDAFQGAVVKYVTRHKEKGGLLDLKKAIHYLQIYIEQLHGVRSKMEYDAGEPPLEPLRVDIPFTVLDEARADIYGSGSGGGGAGDIYASGNGGAGGGSADEHEGFRIGQQVTVFDSYRFGIPLNAFICSFGTKGNAELELLESNNPKFPIGTHVWVLLGQLRQQGGHHG